MTPYNYTMPVIVAGKSAAGKGWLRTGEMTALSLHLVCVTRVLASNRVKIRGGWNDGNAHSKRCTDACRDWKKERVTSWSEVRLHASRSLGSLRACFTAVAIQGQADTGCTRCAMMHRRHLSDVFSVNCVRNDHPETPVVILTDTSVPPESHHA